MATESHGAEPAISQGKNHGAALRDEQKKLSEAVQRATGAIAAMQREFTGVKNPTERNMLAGENNGIEVKITPEYIVDESLSTIKFRPTAEGGPNDVSGVSERTGETWAATIIPETGSVTFQRVDARGGHLAGLQFLRYVPQHEVPQDRNGSASMNIEPATVSIVVEAEGIKQELVFKSPVKKATLTASPLPTSSHPS